MKSSMMIPICFSNPNNVSTSQPPPLAPPPSPPPSPTQQNLITCIYQAQLYKTGPIFLTLSWSKTPSSHTLTIHSSSPDTSSSFSINTTISLFSSTFSSFFKPRSGSGSKSLHSDNNNTKIKLYWDFTHANFPHSNSAEPNSGFYIALVINGRVEFFLGDLTDDFTRRAVSAVGLRSSPELILLSRREHVFGRRNYATKLEFLGTKHDVEIECSGGALKVKIDGETRVVVKHLAWKFRGNERIFINGIEVEFYWDVFNWVNNSGVGSGYGVFVFQIGDGGIWPEMVGNEKRLMKKSMLSIGSLPVGGAIGLGSPGVSCSSSVLQWAEESSDCGRSSSSSSTKSSGGGGGFSLVLYAWRRN